MEKNVKIYLRTSVDNDILFLSENENEVVAEYDEFGVKSLKFHIKIEALEDL